MGIREHDRLGNRFGTVVFQPIVAQIKYPQMGVFLQKLGQKNGSISCDSITFPNRFDLNDFQLLD